ncbi:hypothetical protein HDU86_002510 [Geranomyces michiganensis]|nr:hypothetical protein HDU86_002510 [Geranomyces michiganensis]
MTECDEPLTLEDLEPPSEPRPEPRRFRRLHRYYRSDPVLDDEPSAKPAAKAKNRPLALPPLPDLRPTDGHLKFDFNSALSLNQSRFVFKGNAAEKGVAKRIVPLVPVVKKSIFKKPVPAPEKTEYVHLPKHTRRVIDAISSSIVSLPAPLFVAPKMAAPRRLKPSMDSETNSRKRLRETVEELGGESFEMNAPYTPKRAIQKDPTTPQQRPTPALSFNTPPAAALPFLSQLPPTPKSSGPKPGGFTDQTAVPAAAALGTAPSAAANAGSNVARVPGPGAFGTFGAQSGPAQPFSWFGHQPTVTPAGIHVPAATVTPTPQFGGFGGQSAPPLPGSQPQTGASGPFGVLLKPPAFGANTSASGTPQVPNPSAPSTTQARGPDKTLRGTKKRKVLKTGVAFETDILEEFSMPNPKEMYLDDELKHFELEAAKMDLRCPEFDEWPDAEYWLPPAVMDKLLRITPHTSPVTGGIKTS